MSTTRNENFKATNPEVMSKAIQRLWYELELYKKFTEKRLFLICRQRDWSDCTIILSEFKKERIGHLLNQSEKELLHKLWPFSLKYVEIAIPNKSYDVDVRNAYFYEKNYSNMSMADVPNEQNLVKINRPGMNYVTSVDPPLNSQQVICGYGNSIEHLKNESRFNINSRPRINTTNSELGEIKESVNNVIVENKNIYANLSTHNINLENKMEININMEEEDEEENIIKNEENIQEVINEINRDYIFEEGEFEKLEEGSKFLMEALPFVDIRETEEPNWYEKYRSSTGNDNEIKEEIIEVENEDDRNEFEKSETNYINKFEDHEKIEQNLKNILERSESIQLYLSERQMRSEELLQNYNPFSLYTKDEQELIEEAGSLDLYSRRDNTQPLFVNYNSRGSQSFAGKRSRRGVTKPYRFQTPGEQGRCFSCGLSGHYSADCSNADGKFLYKFNRMGRQFSGTWRGVRQCFSYNYGPQNIQKSQSVVFAQGKSRGKFSRVRSNLRRSYRGGQRGSLSGNPTDSFPSSGEAQNCIQEQQQNLTENNEKAGSANDEPIPVIQESIFDFKLY